MQKFFQSIAYKLLLISSIIAFFLGLLCTSAIVIYKFHDWNSWTFHKFYCEDSFTFFYSIGTTSILLFWSVALIILHKNNITKIKRIIAFCCAILGSISGLVIYTAIVFNLCFNAKETYDYYIMDCKLASNNKDERDQAINALYNIYREDFYSLQICDYDNPYITKAAREGNSKAQLILAIYLHEVAKRNHGETDQFLNRSIYWFMRAANGHNASAQYNLGRMYMHDLLTNLPYNPTKANEWLLKAATNGYVNAYYYLGLLHNDDLQQAKVFWQKGAELGDENCIETLERPEFIN